MIEISEDQSLGEPSELEDEFSNCGKSKIKYTTALLLKLNEVEVCHKLPRDFDLLIFRELHGESDSTLKQKSTSGNSSVLGPLLCTRWNFGLPGERWDNHLFRLSNENNLRTDCGSKIAHVVGKQLPPESGYDAGVLDLNPRKSDPYQLSKCETPYRPPHFNKKVQKPLANISEPEIESSRDSDQIVSADTNDEGNEKSGYEIPLAGVDDSTKKSLGECENSWRNNEENEVIAANETLGETIEDNQLPFDDFWAEILETIHLQQESSISPTNNHADTPDFWAEILETIHLQQESSISPMNTHADIPDPEVEICLPDEDSLISVDYSAMPGISNFSNLESSNDIADSEDEISLPDEDSLISIYDKIAPESSMPCSDFPKANMMSNMKVNIRKNSESLNVTKRGDQSAKVSCTAQSLFDFPGLVTRGNLHSSLSPSEKNSLHLGNDHMNCPPMVMIPNIYPCYIPPPNCFTHSSFHHRSFQGSTLTKMKTNNSFSQYSVLQQPNVSSQQHNHLLFDASACINPPKQVATPELNVMQLLPLTSQQADYHGFRKSNAVDPVVVGGFGGEAKSGFSLWHARF